MQDYALLNTCCIFKYERFCNLQCLLHLNFWIYFLKNMVLHMKMCKSLHIAHFEYATLQYIVPHFGSLFCTLWIFQCAKSCTLQCNISKVPILTLYVVAPPQYVLLIHFWKKNIINVVYESCNVLIVLSYQYYSYQGFYVVVCQVSRDKTNILNFEG